LTGGRRMRPTSLRCSQSRLPHNHGRNHLAAANRLFKQTEPALSIEDHKSLAPLDNGVIPEPYQA
jgi:hypothetical protein